MDGNIVAEVMTWRESIRNGGCSWGTAKTSEKPVEVDTGSELSMLHREGVLGRTAVMTLGDRQKRLVDGARWHIVPGPN